MSNDERLLPTVTRMTGGEVLRVMGPDGKRMLMPLNALLDAAEARFATRTGEAGELARVWTSVTTPGPEGPGFSLRNESFLVPTLLERVRFPGPTPKSSGASPCDGGLVIATDEDSVAVPVPAVNDRVCGTAISSWINALTARIAALEAKPASQTVDLTPLQASIVALRDDLAVLTARVLVLEAQIKTKKDK